MRIRPTFEGFHGVIRGFAERGRIGYLVTPVTSGLRLLHLAKQLGIPPLLVHKSAQELYEERVVKPNRDDAAAVATLLRASGRPVLNPAEVVIPGWQQQDYIEFFLETLQFQVGDIFLGSGWEFSRGCQAEVATGINLNIPVYDTHFNRVGINHLHSLIASALAEARELGLDTSYFSPEMTSVGV